MRPAASKRALFAVAGLAILLSTAIRSAAGTIESPVHNSILVVSGDTSLPISRMTRLGVGKSMIVELPVEVGNVTVSSPEILDAIVQTGTRVVLIGKKTGQANAFFFDQDGSQILTLEVVIETDVTALRTMFERMFPGADLVVENANDNLILKGHLERPIDASRAADIATSFLPEGKKLINMVEVGAKEQVLLHVTVAEMQREVVKRLGVNWSGINIGDQAIGLGTNNGFPTTGSVGSNGFLFGVLGSTNDLGQCVVPGLAAGILSPPVSLAGAPELSCLARTIEAFERNGLVRTLAEPKLTAISGETASFLAGGEFPVPVAQDSNTISVSWKPFGVALSFTPVVLSEDNISLKIATEVSEISTEGAVRLATISIPGINVRRASTTLELPSGGSLVMAGLLSDNLSQSIDGIPGLKNLPVLGALFRSKDYRKQESELVIIVTPYTVNPVQRSALARPDDNFAPASDDRRYIFGHLNRVYGDPDRPPRGVYDGDVGFIIE